MSALSSDAALSANLDGDAAKRLRFRAESSSFARSNTATEIAPATHFQGSNFSGRLHFLEMPEGKLVVGAVVKH